VAKLTIACLIQAGIVQNLNICRGGPQILARSLDEYRHSEVVYYSPNSEGVSGTGCPTYIRTVDSLPMGKLKACAVAANAALRERGEEQHQ